MAGEKLIREAIEAARAAMAKRALPPAENSRLTQIATTGPSYDKALRHLERAGIEGRAIDYGAGRGHGLRSIGADTFEPYPQGWTPTFTKPEDIPDDVYRRLVNLNVLNVLDPEARQSAVLNMGRVVEPGGGGVISTRGRDVMAARGEPGPEPMSLIIGEGDNARYQKGFTPRELREYVGDTLGPRFDVEPSDVGAASIMFRRNREDGGPVEGREDFDKGGLARRAIDAARRVMGYTDPPTKKIEDWQWRPLSEVDKELGLREIPPHVQNFGDYMREMSDKAGSEGLSARDLIKGFTTTRASIQRQAVDADKLRNLGLDLPSDVSRIRPEGAWAEWLMTPMGQRYLDAAAKGTVEGDAVANAIKIMSPFGRHETDIPDAMRWAAQNLPGREARASDLVARAAQGASSPAEWREFTSDIRGVGPSKSGFLASLYGRGDQPTLDARQIILNTGAPTKEAAKYIARGGGEGGVEAVERLAARQRALGLDAPQKYDPFYQHLAHHAIWDKASNETTTHADVVNAMRNAAIVLGTPAAGAALMSDEAEARERASGGRLLEDQYPTHYLPNVGRQVMADGGSPMADDAYLDALIAASQPDADIQRYESRMRDIARQPEDIRSMTHAPSKPMRPIEIEGGLIGKRQLGEAPYDVAGPLSGMAQAAYSLKTVPFYFTPAAPFAAAADLGEAAIDTKSALDKGDYLGAGVTGALGVVAPAVAYRRQATDAVRSGLEAARRFVTSNPGTATAVGAGAAVMTPEEAEAGKSRMVQQVMDIVRGITPPPSNKDPRFWHNISSTKLSRPIDEMRAGYEKVGTDLQPPVRQPSDYEGKAFVTALGDPSIGGVRLLSVNERNLTNPTLMQAGPSFVHGASAQGPDRAIWASDLPLVSALANRAAAAQKAGYEPYLNYVKMGGESPDYSHHITDPLIDLFRQSKVDKGTVADFDKKMREGFNKDFPAYADWPGLRSKNLESYLFGTGPGKARTAMAKLMATGDFQKRGMPDVAAVRFAATEPDLLNAPNYSSGRMIARMDPNAVAIRNPEVPHRTYRAQLAAHPEGADPARFSDNIPLEIAHRDWVEKVRQDMPKISSSNLQFKFQRQSPTLYMTPETVDRMSTFLDLRKRGLIP